jgi:two-component system sensor histidine kinase KdpD
LDATRISSEGVKPRIEWVEPADIVHSAIDRCRRRLAERKLTVDLDPDLPLVHCDPVLVQQALVQIIDNAAKYSHAGSRITVSARAHDDTLTIGVTDQGAGLTKAERAQMWDRFVRGERHVALTGGSGLGLWIANAFVRANGGKMSAASDGPGLGTTTKIELPVTQDAVPQLETDDDE